MRWLNSCTATLAEASPSLKSPWGPRDTMDTPTRPLPNPRAAARVATRAATLALAALATAAPAGPALAQAPIVVTSTASTGLGTLDWAVLQAEIRLGPDSIVFSPALAGATVAVDFALSLVGDLTIDGSAAPGLALSGGWDGLNGSLNGNRIFILPPAPTRVVRISNLILRDGNAGIGDLDGGAILSDPLSNGGLIFMHGGRLELTDVALLAGTAHDGGLVRVNAGALLAERVSFALGRARDDGGAVFVAPQATFEASNCTFIDNVSGFSAPVGSDGQAGGAILAAGVTTLEHCTLAYNTTRDGATVEPLGELRLARNLFAGNAKASGRTDVGPGGTLRGAAGGALGVADGNVSPDGVPGFVRVSEADIRLGGPRYEQARVVAALDCASALYGAIASTGSDQRGVSRGPDSEPGAIETYDCLDTDGDTQVDFADRDDDSDGVYDTTEYGFATYLAAGFTETFGTGTVPAAVRHTAGRVTLDYRTAASGGNVTLTGRADVQGGPGLSLVVADWATTDRAELAVHFSEPVVGLSFRLTDLDVAEGNLLERVDLVLEYEGQVVGISPDDVRLGSNVVQRGNRFEARETLDLDGTRAEAGNVELVGFPNPITDLRIVLSPGDIGRAPGFAHVYLTELRFFDPVASDADGDGLADALDLDADADGLPDRVEAQTSGGFGPLLEGLVPVDTDGDGVPDMLDADSDNDGEPDAVEGHDTNNDGRVDALDDPVFGTGEPMARDADRDGLDDGYDSNPSVFGTGEPMSLQGLPENDAFDVDYDWRDDAANLGAFVWDDVNRDGIRDPNEPPLADFPLEVYRVGDAEPMGTYRTGADGRIFLADFGGFGPPPEGLKGYYVRALAFGGFDNPTAQFRGDDPRVDSDIDPGTMRTSPFQLTTASPQIYIGIGLTDDPLPVELLHIGIDADARCASTLRWEVGPEHDVEVYQVERLDADGTWAVEAEVAATGSATYASGLAVRDATYRLRIVEDSGESRASDTLSAAVCVPESNPDPEFATRLTVAPNPVVRGQSLLVRSPAAAGTEAWLFDLAGRRVLPGALRTDAYGEFRLPTTDLPRGVYVLRVGALAARVVVQ